MILPEVLLLLCFSKASYSGDPVVKKGVIPTPYMGESFQAKYLVLDKKPTLDDLKHYGNTIGRTLKYFTSNGMQNETDVNVALGSFFAGAIFKVILKDYAYKLDDKVETWIKKTIRKLQSILDHWIYYVKDDGIEEPGYKVSEQFKDDTTFIHTISEFNEGRLKKWIFSKGDMHEFVKQMDEATLERDKYTEILESMSLYYLGIDESDLCITRVTEIPVPIDPKSEFIRCRLDPECEGLLHSSPSVAYALSHRQFNIMLRHMTRRCYMNSRDADLMHLDILCAFMFREAIYLARRGFFSRDIFIEHIALCGMLGYEEFYRKSWFYKMASWVDKQGCLPEDRNFEINRTAVYVSRSPDDMNNQHRVRDRLARLLRDPCHTHPMALSMMALALAMRHAIHHLPSIKSHDEL